MSVVVSDVTILSVFVLTTGTTTGRGGRCQGRRSYRCHYNRRPTRCANACYILHTKADADASGRQRGTRSGHRQNRRSQAWARPRYVGHHFGRAFAFFVRRIFNRFSSGCHILHQRPGNYRRTCLRMGIVNRTARNNDRRHASGPRQGSRRGKRQGQPTLMRHHRARRRSGRQGHMR